MLSTLQAAKFLGVSPVTVQRMARRGVLPARRYVRHLRFRLADLQDLADAKVFGCVHSHYGGPQIAS